MKKKSAKKAGGTESRRRMAGVILFFLSAIGLLEGKIFLMAIVHHRDYALLAARQRGMADARSSGRGSIVATDKFGKEIPLALNKNYKVLVASPDGIKNKQETAQALADYFHLDLLDTEKKLSLPHDAREVLARRIDPDSAAGFAEKKLTGISFEDENRRVYPNGSLAAQTLGFVSVENDAEQGRYGLERQYDAQLRGSDDAFAGVSDAGNFWLALGRRIVRPPQGGATVFLTIDYNIQQKAEEVLDAVRKKWNAPSGAVIVMDPASGKILASAGDPAFDPNSFSKEKNFSVFLNPTVEATYELGSVMKPVTMAAGIEEGVITPDTAYTDTGAVQFGSYTVRNYDLQAHGVQTMTQVLEKSLNTGAMYVARLLGHDRQKSYLKKFGFGEKTGADMPGEVAGNIKNLDAGREIDFAAASFGQGISATPLQMARSIAVLANGGALVRPFVVARVVDDSGNEKIINPAVERTVISSSTAESVTKMLVAAVREGFENRAGVKGYFVAGKTGTAQVANKTGRGYSDALIHSFVGYAPAFRPRFLILLQLNEPTGNRFAANTLTPAFHDLAEFILNYYEVPPDER